MHPVFLEEFADYIENFLTTNHNVAIAGDFNLHLNNQEDPEAQIFNDMMDALDLAYHINFPSHQSTHSLHLVFTKAFSEMKTIRCNQGTFLSDHCTIEYLLSFKKCNVQRKEIKYRKLKSINPMTFSQHLKADGFEELSLETVQSSKSS